MPHICRYFKTPKGCVNPRCKFFHPQPGGRGRGLKRGHQSSSGRNMSSWDGAGPSKEQRVSDHDEFSGYFNIHYEYEELKSDYNELVNGYNELEDESRSWKMKKI